MIGYKGDTLVQVLRKKIKTSEDDGPKEERLKMNSSKSVTLIRMELILLKCFISLPLVLDIYQQESV